MCRCVQHRCFTVTLTAFRRPPAARGCPRRVAVIAPVRSHHSRQPRRNNRHQPGLLPQDPHPSPMLDPFHPQVVFAEKFSNGCSAFDVECSMFPIFPRLKGAMPNGTDGRPNFGFRSIFFCSAFLAVTLTRPLQRGCLAAPSEEHFHGQAPPARPDFVKGDGQKTHSRAEKKRP
jgi:hypothetical protein